MAGEGIKFGLKRRIMKLFRSVRKQKEFTNVSVMETMTGLG
jgi:hypothetical protein